VGTSKKVAIMVAKTARVLSAVVAMLIVFAGVRPGVCEGWSLLHPLTFESTPETKPIRPTLKAPPKPPTAMDQIAAAPKNAWNTMTGKKPDPPKATPGMYASVKPPVIQQPPKKESKSWISSMFQPEEPKKSPTVNDFMKKDRVGQ
jgi:hypothetical protein